MLETKKLVPRKNISSMVEHTTEQLMHVSRKYTDKDRLLRIAVGKPSISVYPIGTSLIINSVIVIIFLLLHLTTKRASNHCSTLTERCPV